MEIVFECPNCKHIFIIDHDIDYDDIINDRD